jgi:hypothetical protein
LGVTGIALVCLLTFLVVTVVPLAISRKEFRRGRSVWIQRVSIETYNFRTKLSDVLRSLSEYVMVAKPTPKVEMSSMLVKQFDYESRNIDWSRFCNPFRPNDKGISYVRLAFFPNVWERKVVSKRFVCPFPTRMCQHVPGWCSPAVFESDREFEVSNFTKLLRVCDFRSVYAWDKNESTLNGNERGSGDVGGSLGSNGGLVLSSGLCLHLSESLLERFIARFQSISSSFRRLLSRKSSVFSGPYLIARFRQSVTSELPLAVDVLELYGGQHHYECSGSDVDFGHFDKASVQGYLLVLILLLALFCFSLLALYFAKSSLKNGYAAFIVDSRLFVVFLLIAQGFAILTGIEIARQILGNK